MVSAHVPSHSKCCIQPFNLSYNPTGYARTVSRFSKNLIQFMMFTSAESLTIEHLMLNINI